MFPQSHSAHKVLTNDNRAHPRMIEFFGNNVSIIRQPLSHPMHYMWIDSDVSASQSQGYMLWMVYEWSQALALGHPSRDPGHEEPHKGLIITTMISLGGSYNTVSPTWWVGFLDDEVPMMISLHGNTFQVTEHWSFVMRIHWSPMYSPPHWYIFFTKSH